MVYPDSYSSGEDEDGSYGEVSVSQFWKNKTRMPRRKEKKIRFDKEVGTFTPGEMDTLLTPIPKPYRSQVAVQLFSNMKMVYDHEKSKDGSPSMWDYNSRCLPREFVGLKRETFLVDPNVRNLCDLDQDTLVKICEKLIPLDFVNLSLTCRYLHWRMFTFCRCYAPYTVQIKVVDEELTVGLGYKTMPIHTYFGWSKEIYDMEHPYRLLSPPETEVWRGVFFLQPSCLKRPFHFDAIQLDLPGMFYKKEDYDRCLPLILAVRKYAKFLNVIFYIEDMHVKKLPLFEHPATDDFLKTVKASFVFGWDTHEENWYDSSILHDLWNYCPYTREMDEFNVATTYAGFNHGQGLEMFPESRPMLPWLTCPNKVAFYNSPPEEAVRWAVEQFLSGSTTLEGHIYDYFHTRPEETLMNYLHKQFDFQEYVIQLANPRWEMFRHLWQAVAETGKEGQRVKIQLLYWLSEPTILIAKEDAFEKLEYKHRLCLDNRHPSEDEPTEEEKARVREDLFPPIIATWKMETAVEPEEDEAIRGVE